MIIGYVLYIKHNTGMYNPKEWKELKVQCLDKMIIEKVNHKSNMFDVDIKDEIEFFYDINKNEYYSSKLIKKNLNDFYQDTNGVYYMYNYTKTAKWNKSDDDIVKQSKNALNFKERSNNEYLHYLDKLDKIIPVETVLCCVPSHKVENLETSITDLIKLLAKRNRIDGSACLVRHTTIQKISSSDNIFQRSKKVHEESIHAYYPEIFKNRDVFLIDDVTTTGNSLDACADILINSFPEFRPKSITKFSIWKTI